MSKTFRINLNLEFKNGETLTVEHEAKGENIEEANKNVQLDLSLRIGHFLTRIHPLNFFEQIDPLPHDEEDAAELLAQTTHQQIGAQQDMDLESPRAKFLCDIVRRDLLNLVDRIDTGFDISFEEPADLREVSDLEDTLSDICIFYRGFLRRAEGTPYHDAWVDQQEDNEIGSLLGPETPTT